MTIEQCYTMLQGNYAEAKQRLMTERIIAKFLLKFPMDPTMEKLRVAIRTENHEEAFREAHTLKGVAANLAFTSLQEAASELTEQLRGSDDPISIPLFEKVEECYATVMEAIKAYQSEL